MSEPVPTANELFFGAAGSDAGRLEALEQTFFRSVGLPNGTWKTTAHRRLDDLNALVQPLLPAARPLDIMDVAVSSGVSAVEWLESLEQAGIECRMTAGDAAVNAFLLSFGNRMRALVDPRGYPLQYEVAGIAIGAPLRKRHILKYMLPASFMKMAGRLLRSTLQNSQRAALGQRWGVTWRALQLVSPSLRNRKRIDVVEDDILVNRSYSRCFHAVRAANILNLGYFDEATLTTMLTNLRDRLHPNGILIVCRTTKHENINHASVFELANDGRLRVLARLNEGSEIEPLALALKVAP